MSAILEGPAGEGRAEVGDAARGDAVELSAPVTRSAGRVAPKPKVLADIAVIAQRNIRTTLRQPALIVFVVIQPVLFVLLFRYVFGGAIRGVPGGRYVDFLMPGIITQTVAFGSTGTAIALATDMQEGIIDRFRSLPMSRSAVVAGRVVSDLVRLSFTMSLMTLVGLAVGWRPHVGIRLAPALLVALGFGMAMSWLAAFIGLMAGSEETAQSISFVSTFPLTFASSVFVPVASMPGWLQAIAKVNPITLVASTVRAFTTNAPVGNAWWQALLWIAGLSLVGGTLAVRRFQNG